MERRFPPDLPVIVASTGGVGSKALVNWLYPGAGTEQKESAHSHWRRPPAHRAGGQTWVYVYGDPMTAVISFFQRRESRHDRHDYEPHEYREVAAPHWVRQHLMNMEAPGAETFDQSWTLEDYCRAGVDLFGFREHMDNWMAAKHPVLFIGYQTMWYHRAWLAGKLDADPAAFPEYRSRRASLCDQPKHMRLALEDMYRDDLERFIRLPNCFICREGQILEIAHGIGD